jgi:hypothetical protein
MNQNQIKTLEDLRSYLWEKLHFIDMDTVDEVLDVVKKHRRLLRDHAPANEREYDPNVAPCDDAEFGMKP